MGDWIRVSEQLPPEGGRLWKQKLMTVRGVEMCRN